MRVGLGMMGGTAETLLVSPDHSGAYSLRRIWKHLGLDQHHGEPPTSPLQAVLLPAEVRKVLEEQVEAYQQQLPGDPGNDPEPRVDPDSTSWLPPIDQPSKIFLTGLNYSGHILETGNETPKHPVLFAKFPSALVGHNGQVELYERQGARVDFEGELVVLIGVGGRDIPVKQAFDHVAGYTVMNDVSARDLQLRDKQWTFAKSLDGYGPLGPYLTTADEITDPQNLILTTRVNGEVKQRANTSEMVFGVAELVSAASESCTLVAGDIIATGTPGGVGHKRVPPEFLTPGDVVTIHIQELGTLRSYFIKQRERNV